MDYTSPPPPPGKFLGLFPPPVLGVIWVLGCGLIDWRSGSEWGVSGFYLPGIIFTAWYSGRNAALAIVLAAAAVWLTVELVWESSYSNPLIPIWNSLIRFFIFAVTALLTSEVRIRRQAEAALQRQKEILASILDSMRDGVVVVDRNAKIIVSNPAASELFGEIRLGGDAYELLRTLNGMLPEPSGDDERGNPPLHQRLVDSEDRGVEVSLRRHPSGELTHLSITAQPLMGRNSKQAGLVLVFNDLTTRRKLEHQISQASEREQRRIGQDLHDGVCQHLAGISFAAATLQSELESLGMPSQAAGAAEIAELMRDGIQQARDIARGLYPVGIEEGLEVAMKSLAANTENRSGIPCRFVQTGTELELDLTAAGHLYKIAQEAVNNAIRHGKPTGISIHLDFQADSLMLEIADDGLGIEAVDQPERGIGLQIMRYRADLIGAQLDISSREGEGVTVRAAYPLPAPPM